MPPNIPLAERIRPTNIEEFCGQEHLKDRLIAMGKNRLSSLLFFGPPGCGKSTIALLLAATQGKKFLRLSAPETGISNLRKQIQGVEILILDELHRFSKAQQDFFLPYLENGSLTLLATTTENPSFCITRQLLSRLHVLRLRPLSHTELLAIARRGMTTLGISLPDDSLDLLTSVCSGDARTLLNLVEYACGLEEEKRQAGPLKDLLPEIILRSDRDGDNHYEQASALIKSIRGSDPDAAVYYLATMLESGQDPLFVCRRLVLSASEDIGLADPSALTLAVSCLHAVQNIGMPEGFIPMSETAIYLALAPKSNSSYAAYRAAQKEIRFNGTQPVPLHLRNATTALQKEWGYGKGYKYPHAFPGAWIQQDYLPPQLQNRTFYQPKTEGAEARLNAWIQSKHKK